MIGILIGFAAGAAGAKALTGAAAISSDTIGCHLK
jgi:hypothetical protein